MTKAGRRRSVVWECFTDHPTSGKRRVLCRFCSHDTVANPIRMVRHIIKYCPHADDKHKRICREYQSLTVPARRREGGGPMLATADSGSNQHTSRGGNNSTTNLEQLQLQHHPLQLHALPAPTEAIQAQFQTQLMRMNASSASHHHSASFQQLQPSGVDSRPHLQQHQRNLSFGR